MTTIESEAYKYLSLVWLDDVANMFSVMVRDFSRSFYAHIKRINKDTNPKI